MQMYTHVVDIHDHNQTTDTNDQTTNTLAHITSTEGWSDAYNLHAWILSKLMILVKEWDY